MRKEGYIKGNVALLGREQRRKKVMIDNPICANCKHWNRTGATTGHCNNERSSEFERITNINHVCMPPFESKF